MNLSNLIKIAWRAIVLNKIRTFLTMLGVIIGVASVITMLAIGEGSKAGIKEQISSMGSNMITIRPGSMNRGGVRIDDGSALRLSNTDFQAIQNQAKLISQISPVVSSGGRAIYASNNWPVTITGVSPEYLQIRKLEISKGQNISEQHIHTSAKVAVIGQTVVDNLFSPNEDPIGKTIRLNKTPLLVIGILQKKGEAVSGQDQDNIILAPYTTVQKRMLTIQYLHSIVASAVDENAAEAAVEEITQILRKSQNLRSHDENTFRIFSMDELIQTFNTTGQMLTILLVAIASISLLIGGIGIMNIMYVSVKERTREIGLRMAVGAKSNDILMQFLTEAIFISVSGGLLGVILGISATYGISFFLQWPTLISAYSIAISFLVCVCTGIFFGWYPARKAASLNPIDAIRYE